MKKKYTIYANCQGHGVAMALNSSQAFRSQYDYIVTKPIQALELDDINRLTEEVIPTVDLFICQPVSEKYKHNFKYSTKYMLEQLKSNCRAISFPTCYFRGYNPELRLIKDENYENIDIAFKVNGQPLKSMLVHDANIVKSFLEDKSINEIKEQFLDNDFYNQLFLDRLVQETLNELKFRESRGDVDIKISSFVESNFRAKKLFHIFNHPTGTLFEYIAERVLELLSIQSDFNNIPDALEAVSFPIYTSAYSKLEFSFDTLSKHKIYGKLMDLEDVIKQYFEFYKTIPETVLRKNIEDWNIGKLI